MERDGKRSLKVQKDGMGNAPRLGVNKYNKSGYTREKIRNLNDHCNDDCNSSFELSDLTHEKKFVT